MPKHKRKGASSGKASDCAPAAAHGAENPPHGISFEELYAAVRPKAKDVLALKPKDVLDTVVITSPLGPDNIDACILVCDAVCTACSVHRGLSLAVGKYVVPTVAKCLLMHSDNAAVCSSALSAAGRLMCDVSEDLAGDTDCEPNLRLALRLNVFSLTQTVLYKHRTSVKVQAEGMYLLAHLGRFQPSLRTMVATPEFIEFAVSVMDALHSHEDLAFAFCSLMAAVGTEDRDAVVSGGVLTCLQRLWREFPDEWRLLQRSLETLTTVSTALISHILRTSGSAHALRAYMAEHLLPLLRRHADNLKLVPHVYGAIASLLCTSASVGAFFAPEAAEFRTALRWDAVLDCTERTPLARVYAEGVMDVVRSLARDQAAIATTVAAVRIDRLLRMARTYPDIDTAQLAVLRVMLHVAMLDDVGSTLNEEFVANGSLDFLIPLIRGQLSRFGQWDSMGRGAMDKLVTTLTQGMCVLTEHLRAVHGQRRELAGEMVRLAVDVMVRVSKHVPDVIEDCLLLFELASDNGEAGVAAVMAADALKKYTFPLMHRNLDSEDFQMVGCRTAMNVVCTNLGNAMPLLKAGLLGVLVPAMKAHPSLIQRCCPVWDLVRTTIHSSPAAAETIFKSPLYPTIISCFKDNVHDTKDISVPTQALRTLRVLVECCRDAANALVTSGFHTMVQDALETYPWDMGAHVISFLLGLVRARAGVAPSSYLRVPALVRAAHAIAAQNYEVSPMVNTFVELIAPGTPVPKLKRVRCECGHKHYPGEVILHLDGEVPEPSSDEDEDEDGEVHASPRAPVAGKASAVAVSPSSAVPVDHANAGGAGAAITTPRAPHDTTPAVASAAATTAAAPTARAAKPPGALTTSAVTHSVPAPKRNIAPSHSGDPWF